MPRIVEGKYLKLLYAIHKGRGTLRSVPAEICPSCDLGVLCPVSEKLSVLCLEGIFHQYNDYRAADAP